MRSNTLTRVSNNPGAVHEWLGILTWPPCGRPESYTLCPPLLLLNRGFISNLDANLSNSPALMFAFFALNASIFVLALPSIFGFMISHIISIYRHKANFSRVISLFV